MRFLPPPSEAKLKLALISNTAAAKTRTKRAVRCVSMRRLLLVLFLSGFMTGAAIRTDTLQGRGQTLFLIQVADVYALTSLKVMWGKGQDGCPAMVKIEVSS